MIKRVINFSGGKSSALMTIMEYNPITDIVIFCDTGREHPKTYKFIQDFQAYENIPVIILGGKGEFQKYLGKRNFDHIPNRVKRSCTIELKIKPARRYARSVFGMSYSNLIGFRNDEQLRIHRHVERWKKVNTLFPLDMNKITKEYVNDYWAKKPYTLEIPHILGNCVLCFMKGKDAIINILRKYPEYANEYIQDEKKCKYRHTYLDGYSMSDLLNLSKQPTLFDVDLNKITPAYNCACTS